MNTIANGDFESYEAICVLNLSEQTAHNKLIIYFEDAEPLLKFMAVCEKISKEL